MESKFIISTRTIIYKRLILLCCAIGTTVPAKALRTGEAFSLYVENDTRGIGGPGSDQAYSNGLKFSYLYAEDQIPVWSKAFVQGLPYVAQQIEKSKVNYGLSFGHQIYTPNNLDVKTLIVDDRPYVAWLYLGFSLSFKEERIGHFLEFNLGMVGPSALGQEVQNSFHDLLNVHHAQGWKNGLNDELTLQLFYQRRDKFYQTQNFDFIPYYGAAFGNVQIGAHAGGLVRYGVNLPDDFGPSRPSAGDGDIFVSPWANATLTQSSYYFFAGLRGNAIARNLFLDGNNFQVSHHVKKNPTNLTSEFGLGLEIKSIILVWRFVTRSPEFAERSNVNSFASLNMIYLL